METIDLVEIAQAVSVSKRAIEKRATRNNWPYSESTCRGGKKRLYFMDELPAEIKEAINKHRSTEIINQSAIKELNDDSAQKINQVTAKQTQKIKQIEEGRRQYNALDRTDARRIKADARHWLVRQIFEISRIEQISHRQAGEHLAYRVNTGAIILPQHVLELLPNRCGTRELSPSTLYKWLMAYKNNGIWGLVTNYGNRKGQSKISQHPELQRLVLGHFLKYPQITSKALKQLIAAERPDLNIVSQSAIANYLKQWRDDNPQLLTYLQNPDRWKNIYMSGVGSVTEDVHRPNQIWELDSTPGEWLLTDGSRHVVVGCIDLHTRRVKPYVSKTSTAAAVKQVMRRSILDWGIPEIVRTDNGKDYVSESVDNLLFDLQIDHQICVPFASEEKGTIERFFRTMSHGILNLLEGFIGHNVAERKAIESRKSFAQRIMKKDEVVEVSVSPEQLQEILDDWVEAYYENEPHSGLNGQTPMQAWRSYSHTLREITDPHALDELMSDIAGDRVIGKKGIRFNNHNYHDLDGLIFRHAGEQVRLRYDEQDIGRLAVYLAEDGQFLCWAECPEILGISRNEHAKAIKSAQKKFMAEQAAEARRFTRQIKQNPVQAVIEHRKAEAGNVTDLPKRKDRYSTPALESAQKAHQARNPKQPHKGGLNEQEKELQKQLESRQQQKAQPAPKAAPVQRIKTETPEQRFARACRLENKEDSLLEVDRRWLRNYQQSNEYQARKRLKKFGQSESLGQ